MNSHRQLPWTHLRIRHVALGLLAFLIILPLVAANTSNALAQTPDAIEVDINLNEWALNPEDFNFQAGDRVIFNITNTGRFSHAFEVSNNAQHLHSPTIGANETTTLEITFDDGGEYNILCPIPGHAALGMVGTLSVDGAPTAPDTGEFLGIPLMRISPRAGTEVQGSSQEVRVILHDFTLSPDSIESSQNVDGEGNWELFLDDQLVGAFGEPSTVLEDLTPGEHDIRVELKNNDSSPLDTPLVATTSITVIPDTQVDEDRLEAALLQSYFISVDNFAGPVMMGGMGIPLVPNMIPPEMFQGMMQQMAQMANFDPANMPANPGLLAAIYTSGQPALPAGAEVNPMDFATMRWDSAQFDTNITTRDQAMVIMKFVEWAKFFHKGFNGENILFPTPEMEAFLSLAFTAEGMMISNFAGQNLMTPDGYITSISMDGGQRAVVDDTIDPFDQAAMLWALSDLMYTMKDAENFPNLGALAQQMATPEQMQGLINMWMRTFELVQANPVSEPKDAGLAIVSLVWFAAAMGDQAPMDAITAAVDDIASGLGDDEDTAFEKAASIRGLIEAWRLTGNDDYLDTALDLWDDLEGMWDDSVGAYAPTSGASTYTYTPWDAGLIVGALSEIIAATGDAVNEDTKNIATNRFLDFLDSTIVASGFTSLPVPTPGGAGLFSSEVSYDTASGSWTVTDSRYTTAGAQYTANELIWMEGTLQGRLSGYPTIPVVQTAAAPPASDTQAPSVGDITVPAWGLAGIGLIGAIMLGSGTLLLVRRRRVAAY